MRVNTRSPTKTKREAIKTLLITNLANQEKQITELEDRLAKLRDQLKRRRDAKDKMVDLKLEMVLSQAEGLGWPDNSSGDWLSRVEERYSFPPGAAVNLVAPASLSPLGTAIPPQPAAPPR